MKKIAAWFCIWILLFGGAAALAQKAEETPPPDLQALYDGRVTASYWVEIPGRVRPVLYYAQNDPVWGDVPFKRRDKSHHPGRTIALSGCEPTAMAIVLRHLLTDEELMSLFELSFLERGLDFCICSAAPFGCSKKHEQYPVDSQEKLSRYFAVVMAGFAGGNNPIGLGGHNTINMITHAYDLEYRRTGDDQEAVKAIDRGAIAIISSGSNTSAISATGHYLTLMGSDEEYLYFLDPFLRDSYEETDRNRVIELISPGYFRVKRENQQALVITGYLLFEPRNQ